MVVMPSGTCKLAKMFNKWTLIDADSVMVNYMFQSRCPGPYKAFWDNTTRRTRRLYLEVDDTQDGFLWSLEWL